MSEQGKQDRTDKLRAQVWRHLELGQWHSAALLSEHMTEVDPLSSLTGLAEATRALAMISEAIRLNEPVDPHVLVRLDEMASTWPRLAAMRSFQALVQAVREAAAKGQEKQTSMSDAVAQTTPPKAAPQPQRRKPGRSLLSRIARPEGWAGIGATVACILAVLLICNSTAYYYLREQPISADGPEAGAATWQVTEPWHGLIDLEGPVDTIILGDSTAGVNLLPGPIADRLGGTAINLSTNFATSLLMDAWMLQYYVDRFGPPRNVILLRNCHGYETESNLELLSNVPLEWGYWDRLGVVPDWGSGEQLSLLLAKYGVLYSRSDILAYRLTHLLDLLAQPYSRREPIPYYFRGSTAPSALDDFRRENTVATYTPFMPISDSENAVGVMAEQARALGFQLYLVVGPEWDEAYQDPDRQAKVSGMVEWLGQHADPQNVHVVLSEPMIFQAEQMQNINHLRPGAEKQYTEAVVEEIAAIQNDLTVGQSQFLGLASVVLNSSLYEIGEQPTVTLSLKAEGISDYSAFLEGEVSCLVRWAGKSETAWVSRAPAAAFSVASGSTVEVDLTLTVGKLGSSGAYDLVVFIRQDVGGLSCETRIEMPKMLKVS